MKKKPVKMTRTTWTAEPEFIKQAQSYADSLPEHTSLSALIRHLLHLEMFQSTPLHEGRRNREERLRNNSRKRRVVF